MAERDDDGIEDRMSGSGVAARTIEPVLHPPAFPTLEAARRHQTHARFDHEPLPELAVPMGGADVGRR